MWILLFALFLIPGAYLEYPSDPWEHFRRIYQWQAVNTISDYQPSSVRFKFSYFWAWSFMAHVPIEYRRLALAIYAAVIQWVLSIQIYQLSRWLKFDRAFSLIQVVGFWGLFGTNLFSFRYYALSSTPLSYIAYLKLLQYLLGGLELGIKPLIRTRWPSILALGSLITLNHNQGWLYLAISVIALAVFRAREISSVRTGFLKWAIIGVILSWIGGYWAIHQHPEWYANSFRDHISFLGTFKVWRIDQPYFETLGVHGVVSLLMAFVIVLRSSSPHRRLIATLSLTPFFILLFPPAVLLIVRTFGKWAPYYRVLYAIPLSFVLVAGLRQLSLGISERVRIPLVLMALLALSIPYTSPWRGRLFFQFHTPPSELAMTHLDATASWVATHIPHYRKCHFITDDITYFVLSTHLGIEKKGDRLEPYFVPRVLRNWDKMTDFINLPEFCGLLIADPQIRFPRSRVAESSGHWSSELSDQTYLVSGVKTRVDTDPILSHWQRVAVPPYFELWQPSPGDLPGPKQYF